jgi:hypothetical protein
MKAKENSGGVGWKSEGCTLKRPISCIVITLQDLEKRRKGEPWGDGVGWGEPHRENVGTDAQTITLK